MLKRKMGAAAIAAAAAVAAPMAVTHAQSTQSTFRSTESEAQVATFQRPPETRASRSELRQPIDAAFLHEVGKELRAAQHKHDLQVAAYRRKLAAEKAAARAAAQRAARARAAFHQRSYIASYSGGSVKSYAARQVAARGWSSQQFGCLDTLWNRESGWQTHAANASGAYGIPQALPGSKMASAGSDWHDNPYTQIRWGLGYIAGDYGTPCGALAHSDSYGWY